MQVEGYEKSHWVETHTDHRTNERRTRNYGGCKSFFSVSIPLQQYSSPISPGQYEYPFTFVLPVSVA
jgi:hypothetical protein